MIKKFWKILVVPEKASTFALAFEKYLANEVTQGKKKEFFEKIYIKQKVVVQEASEKSLG